MSAWDLVRPIPLAKCVSCHQSPQQHDSEFCHNCMSLLDIVKDLARPEPDYEAMAATLNAIADAVIRETERSNFEIVERVNWIEEGF